MNFTTYIMLADKNGAVWRPQPEGDSQVVFPSEQAFMAFCMDVTQQIEQEICKKQAGWN